MTEHDIEIRRWRAHRILKADHGVCEEWQTQAARIFLANSRPGRTPSGKVTSVLRQAWSVYWTRPRVDDIPDDADVLEG